MPVVEEGGWPAGPARYFAAGVLAGASLLALVWLVATRTPSPAAAPVSEEPHASARLISGATEPAPAPTTLRVDLNAAAAGELRLLPGIGPALAERIVADRARHGPFASVDAVTRVSGIGPRTVERIRPYVQARP